MGMHCFFPMSFERDFFNKLIEARMGAVNLALDK